MASNTLMTQLPKTQFSGLEYTNIMEDIHNLVKENPDFNSNWNDFLNSNAGRMLTEVFAWIADQLATRIDWVVNENFIGTATQRSSIIRLLKLIGYKFSLPVASEVTTILEFSSPVANNYILTPTYIEGSGIFTPKIITGIDKKGNSKSFEALIYDSVNQKYSYKVPVVVNTGDINNPILKQEIKFYEGQTKLKNFIAASNQGQKFILTDNPIVRNSIVVYLLRTDGATTTEEELMYVDNFLDSKAQKAYDLQGTNAIPYTLNVREDDSVEIEFGPIALLSSSDRRLPEGSEIRVFYRVGGGLDGNISRQSINIVEKITIDSQEVIINFYNELEGISGQDSETVEHAAYNGPLKIKTGGKTVTTEDYDIMLSGHTSVLRNKSYGYNNIPWDYFAKYGTYFNPMEVMNYVIIKKPGWEDVPTSKYYLADWGTFNLENRFNGKYYFNLGNFGNSIDFNTGIISYGAIYDYDNQGGREFKNFVVLKTNSDWKQSLFVLDTDGITYVANKELIASLTKTQYDSEFHTKLDQIGDHVVYDTEDPYFHGDYLETDFPRIEIREDIQAYFKSTRDVSAGLNISNGRNRFILNVDGHGDVVIDLSRGGTSPAVVPLDTLIFGGTTIYGIIDIINEAIGNAYSGVFAYQDFGILIPDVLAQVPNLENRDEESWIIRISGINYVVNTSVQQSYTHILGKINEGINPSGYEAIFIQNHVNITCYDIRVQRTTLTGTVILEDSNDPFDILVAFEAIPLHTMPVSSGDYSNVASKVIGEDGSCVKLLSPNKGSVSSISIKPSVSPGQNCLLSLFNLDVDIDLVTSYECYGQRALTVIYRDSNEADFGDLIYEHGTVNFSDVDPKFIYLNFISSKKDIIKLGYYFNENFDISDPEWKPVDKRIYNTQYIVDPEDSTAKRELFDIDHSDILLKFTSSEERGNSIYIIENDYDLKRATSPTITSKFMHEFPDLDNKTITFQINDNYPISIFLTGINTLAELATALNTPTVLEQTNEYFKGNLQFAKLDVDAFGKGTILLHIDNNTDGKIMFIGEVSSASYLFFDEIETPETNHTVYADGDYYLALDPVTDTINMVKTNSATNIPDVPFYTHYVIDNRHTFIDPEVQKTHTDEDDLQFYMYPYKVAGIQNVFTRPVFTTFDLKADVYCSKAIPREQIKFNVTAALKSAYSLSAAEFNKPVIRAEVTKIIMDVPGVRYVEIRYFGKDMIDQTTNVENRVESGFDEIIVMSDDTFDSKGAQLHGQDISYNVI